MSVEKTLQVHLHPRPLFHTAAGREVGDISFKVKWVKNRISI